MTTSSRSSSVGRAPDFQSGGHEFESRLLLKRLKETQKALYQAWLRIPLAQSYNSKLRYFTVACGSLYYMDGFINHHLLDWPSAEDEAITIWEPELVKRYTDEVILALLDREFLLSWTINSGFSWLLPSKI